MATKTKNSSSDASYDASDITIVPDTADLRAYLAKLREHLPGEPH